MVQGMWRLLDSRWAKRVGAFDALNSLGKMVVVAVSGLVGMIGAFLSWLDDQSYLRIGLAFLTFAFVTAVAFFFVAAGVQMWRGRMPGRNERNAPPARLEKTNPAPVANTRSLASKASDITISMDETVHLLMERVGYEALTGPAFNVFLREGRITAFGRPIVGAWDPSSGHELGAEIEIPAEYWEDAEPRWTSHQVSAMTLNFDGGLEYGLVHFVRDHVMRCFFGDKKDAQSTPGPPMSAKGPM